MWTTTRLLLPFTRGINALALSYAVQLAEQHGATLVALALVPVRLGEEPRLELIQQAQDFLVLTQRKAERQGVPLEASQISTSEVTRSVNVFASEMSCEAVILFVSNTSEVLLGRTEVRTLMDSSAHNIHMVLLPEKRRRFASKHPLHMLLLKCSSGETYDTDSNLTC